MHLANAELRAATDAAAKAATTKLGLSSDLNLARQAAIQLAAANDVDGKPLILENQDIVFGRVQLKNNGTLSFTSGSTPYNAVQISGRKLKSSPSGGIPLLFGPILGTGTFETQMSATAAVLDRDVCLSLDRSGSMAGQKLADLKTGVGIFLDTVNDGKTQPPLVGLVSYSTDATIDKQLTSDFDKVRQKTNAMVADGWTNIADGINAGRDVLSGGHDAQFAQKIMVLMTDGIHNQPPSPEDAAQAAKLENIVIHTITFGDDADQSRMQAIANTTGGTFHHAPDGATLQQAFRDIAMTIRTSLTQ